MFRAANTAPDGIRAPVRALMQAGAFGMTPLFAAVALLTGRRWLAGVLLAGGTAAWFRAKAVKPLSGRPRPSGVLTNVVLREPIASDLGWVSGHTAVATTLAFAAAEELPASARPVLAAWVNAVGFGRMYVGAHLPQDVVGGAGLGMMLSSFLSLWTRRR